jgi:hypothetical protein
MSHYAKKCARFRIEETGELRTLVYYANLDLADCGFNPYIMGDICKYRDDEVIYDRPKGEYLCSEEIFGSYADLVKKMMLLDSLGEHLIACYGFQLMEIRKLRPSGFPCDPAEREERYALGYKNMIVASNTIRLKRHFGESAGAEAEALYGYERRVPAEYKGLYIKIDGFYQELIEWAATSPEALEAELEWLSKSDASWRNMAARGLVSMRQIGGEQ